MRVICAVLALALLGAAAPEPSATPAADRFPELLGTWTCRDGANVTSTLTFTRDRDAIAATERKAIANGPSSDNTQRYRFDAASGRWHVEDRRGYVNFSGSAPPWTGPEWNVEGTTTYSYAMGGRPQQVPRTIRYVRAGSDVLYRGDPDDGPARVNGAVCARGAAPPETAMCPAKRVPAMTLSVSPIEPQYGDRGTVEIAVALDADSRIVGTRVASTTNLSLNRTAEYAARKSTYRTEFRDCRPVPSEYLFTIEAI